MLTRRQFVRRLAASAALAVPMITTRRVLGANDEIRAAVVGLGGRGSGAHVPGLESLPGVSVVALCDADLQRAGQAASAFASRYGRAVDVVQDMRRVFDRADVDVVANATQNYWHALSTIWACQAGKHVYCEKPLSHYIWEGRQMVRAARRYRRIVQCGTQRRSQRGVIDAIAYLQAGHLGAVRLATAFANKARLPIGKLAEPLAIPAWIDYDLWCGPAQKEPIYRPRLHYDCSFVWNTGDGESCNQGVHEVDMARWALGVNTLPHRVISLGGRFHADDAADVPNTQILCYDYPDSPPILYELHNLPTGVAHLADPSAFSRNMPNFRGQSTGVLVECEGGSLALPACVAYDRQGKEIARFSGGEDHFANFIAAVRSGRAEELRADVEVGHLSTAICHAGNISYRVGRPAAGAELRAQVEQVPALAEMFDRFTAYLARLEIDWAGGAVTLGPWLEIDAQRECFVGHDEANRLVRGFYREPYTIPEIAG